MATTMMVDAKEGIYTKEQTTIKAQNKGNEESWCPLFSEGLPSDFASNSKLAAIASLLNDDSTEGNGDDDSQHSDGIEEQNDIVRHEPVKMSSGKASNKIRHGNSPRAGGGKSNRNKRRQRKSGMPYDKEKHVKKNTPTKSASVGEAQLFLNLWKL